MFYLVNLFYSFTKYTCAVLAAGEPNGVGPVAAVPNNVETPGMFPNLNPPGSLPKPPPP
jgi:hypothetical protein